MKKPLGEKRDSQHVRVSMCVRACERESAREKEREFPLKALATFERLQPNKRFEIQNDKSSELKICLKHKRQNKAAKPEF